MAKNFLGWCLVECSYAGVLCPTLGTVFNDIEESQ